MPERKGSEEARGSRRVTCDSMKDVAADIRKWCRDNAGDAKARFKALKRRRQSERRQNDRQQETAARATQRGKVKHTWLRSQNVRGLVKTQTRDWFQHFRRKHEGAFAQATLLQETHCTREDAVDLERQYAGLWGYRAQDTSPMSYWSAGGRQAGVAILLAPEAAASWTPACETHWTTNFISQGSVAMVRHLITTTAPLHADHKGILLGLVDPAHLRIHRPRTVLYPPPDYAAAAATGLIEHALQAAGATCGVDVQGWERLKRQLSAELRRCYTNIRQTMTRSHRQRLRRLVKAQGKIELRCGRGQATEHDGAQLRALGEEVARLHAEWHRATQHARAARRLHDNWQSTRAAFQRVSVKRAAQPIDHIQPTAGFPIRDARHLADALADGWVATLTSRWHDQTKSSARRDMLTTYVAGTTACLDDEAQRMLDEDITENEVRAAIATLERQKSPGPDQLPNDFYLDNVDSLAGPLAALYQQSWATGAYPSGHREATIFAVAKGAASSDPLQYCPLAMLNTDYKILAKVIATRLRQVVRQLVHADQHAFVPGRAIHEAIDILEACCVSCQQQPTEDDPPVALMLDFAKAYDTIERDYLLEVLREMHLPPRFIQFVRATHTDTLVKFLVNGSLSRAIGVTRGIRQGCPLAPMLFILGLEPLIHRVLRHPRLNGISLRALGEVKDVRLVAYADDTTVYLLHASQLAEVRVLLDGFAACAGLAINLSKSLVVPLGTLGGTPVLTTDFPVLAEGATTRYLGIRVGQGIATTETWDATFRALRVRMVLAERKLHTAIQRAQLASAIVVPKLLFIARHAFPTAAQRRHAQQVIDNYVWASTCSTLAGSKRAWVHRDIAALPLQQGGLAVPQLKLELQMLGVRAILRWDTLLVSKARVATTVLLLVAIPGQLYEAASGVHCILRTPVTTQSPMLGATLWDSGYRALCHGVDGAADWNGCEPIATEWPASLRVLELASYGVLPSATARAVARGHPTLTLGEAMDQLESTKRWLRGQEPHVAVPARRISDLKQLERAVGWRKREVLRWLTELRVQPATADTTEFSWTMHLAATAQLDLKH